MTSCAPSRLAFYGCLVATALGLQHPTSRPATAQARARLAVLAALDLPSVAEKPYVCLNTGGTWRSRDATGFNYLTGWLLSASQDSVTLLNADRAPLEHRLHRPLSAEARALVNAIPKDKPQPFAQIAVDFEQIARERCEAEVRDAWQVLDLALHAHWCFQRGLEALGLALFDRAGLAASMDRSGEDRSPLPFDTVLVERVAGRLHALAIEEASEGKRHDQLRRRWLAIETLPANRWTALAREMGNHYAAMIEEDKGLRDLEPQAVADKIAWWIHKLRDHNARQWMQPGGVSVFDDRFWKPELRKPNPAAALRQIGWAALPQIIDHLDDMRPTRCFGYWRTIAPDSYYLLRVADCCQQIFEAITGVSLYVRWSTQGTLTNDHKQDRARQAAQAWWQANQKHGEEGFQLLRLCDTDPSARDFAAVRLLTMDATRHLPRVLAILADQAGKDRGQLLARVGPWLGKEHTELVASFLGSSRFHDVLIAARVLAGYCGSTAGVSPLAQAVRRLDDGDEQGGALRLALGFLAGFPTDEVAELITDLMESGHGGIRMLAMGCQCPHPKVAEALVRALDATRESGWSGAYPIRFCDQAAESLVRLLQYPTPWPRDPDAKKRDAFIAELQRWWNDHQAEVDWAQLRRSSTGK